MGIRRRLDTSSPRSSGYPATRGLVVLVASFCASAVITLACAGSDQQMSLQRELDAALLERSDRSPAQCHPGGREACYSGPEGTSGRGQCTPGTRQCDNDGMWLGCAGEVLPSTRELCNDIDDDCNGVVDDGFQRAGAQCWTGKGECRSRGVFRCSSDGTRSECNAQIKNPGAEICDGKDNNCDGQIDEGNMAGAGVGCSTGRAGACSSGHKQCVKGQMLCVADHQPGIEVCNKIDDDCDNEIDEECVDQEEAKKIRAVK